MLGRHIVIEEKLDGSNVGIKIRQSKVVPQSRGHELTRGGSREQHFDLFKTWCAVHQEMLIDLLGERYILFGEWMLAKHTIYYDKLPHYFQEFDVYDTHTEQFLSTKARRNMLSRLPICSVPVLYEGTAPKRLKDVLQWIQSSLAKSAQWRQALDEEIKRTHVNPERTWQETLQDEFSEGLYIKIEDDQHVLERLKWVRPDFLQSLQEQTTHWAERRVIHNQLVEGVDLFSPKKPGWFRPLPGGWS